LTNGGGDPTPVSVRWDTAGDVPVLRVAGEVDYGSADVVRDELLPWLEQSSTDLVLDLTGVTSMGSVGLALVLEAHRRAQRVGVRFVVAAGQRAVLRPLQLALLNRAVDVRPDLDQALAAARGAEP
jgi:anti-sigma B factor antagonist